MRLGCARGNEEPFRDDATIRSVLYIARIKCRQRYPGNPLLSFLDCSFIQSLALRWGEGRHHSFADVRFSQIEFATEDVLKHIDENRKGSRSCA